MSLYLQRIVDKIQEATATKVGECLFVTILIYF